MKPVITRPAGNNPEGLLSKFDLFQKDISARLRRIISVALEGTEKGSGAKINFIAGANITITVVENKGQIDVTISTP